MSGLRREDLDRLDLVWRPLGFVGMLVFRR
jgi:hypothetical protein